MKKSTIFYPRGAALLNFKWQLQKRAFNLASSFFATQLTNQLNAPITH
jgi:hypothetical protein